MISRSAVYFYGGSQVKVLEDTVQPPGPGQVLVQGLVSAISAGTELLVYRGQVPEEMAVDSSIEALAGKFVYPLKYGYAMAGVVKSLGAGVEPAWQDRSVFAFHPHESFFLTASDRLIPLPEGLDPLNAVFAPNMETAVTFLLDGRPLIGERVVIFGQGVVGLLTTALLARMSLASLVTVDPLAVRRKASRDLGATTSLDSRDPDALAEIETYLGGPADLVLELSGAPQVLNQAIAVTGYSGRIVVGSWYGTKRAEVDLGGHFHRNRLKLISSQVSSIAPNLLGRWNKTRRMDWAMQMLTAVNPAQFISHQIPVAAAAEAYKLLDRQPEAAIQVVLKYP